MGKRDVFQVALICAVILLGWNVMRSYATKEIAPSQANTRRCVGVAVDNNIVYRAFEDGSVEVRGQGKGFQEISAREWRPIGESK